MIRSFIGKYNLFPHFINTNTYITSFMSTKKNNSKEGPHHKNNNKHKHKHKYDVENEKWSDTNNNKKSSINIIYYNSGNDLLYLLFKKK